ncbi:MAG: hypothetical protein ABI651_02565 [Verrucomicrobiota bacterium]
MPRSAVLVLAFAWSAASVRAQSAAVSSVSPPSTIYHLDPVGKSPDVKEVQPLVDWLPVWGREAREKGFDLPLPFGVGVTYTYLDQNMVVSDVKIAGRPLDVNIRDAKTTTHTGVFRGDMWLFPFLNVYGLIGETAGVTRPAVVFPNGQVLESEVKYNRFSYGGGATLAGGWKAWFLTIDANWTSGDLVSKDGGQISDDPIRSLTFTPRFGTLFSAGRMGTGALWVGGMYLLATSEIHDSIDLSKRPILAELVGRDSLNYSVRVEPKENWNLSTSTDSSTDSRPASLTVSSKTRTVGRTRLTTRDRTPFSSRVGPSPNTPWRGTRTGTRPSAWRNRTYSWTWLQDPTPARPR